MSEAKNDIPMTKFSMKMVESAVSLNKHRNDGGLNWMITALFIVGELAGAGIVALPTAMAQTNFYPGIALNICMLCSVTYTGHLLGVAWATLQRRWPEYREHCRNPYPEMGVRAMGPVIKLLVSICIDLTQFSASVVLLLLASKNIRDSIEAFFHVDISFCFIILVVGFCILPLTLLKSPQDFWFAVVMAMVTTSCAVVLLIIGMIIDYPKCAPERGDNEKFVLKNYFLAFGTFIFAYSGHAAFPTIIHDMQRPYHFTRSSLMAYIIIAAMYGPVSIIGYLTYGNSLQDSIINSIQTVGLQQPANILITMHCILTLTIMFNPLNQEVEEFLDVPHKFCWQRVAVRSGVMIAVIFVAESIPTFGPLLDLVGGSTLTLTSLVFPCLFYLYLTTADKKALKNGGNIEQPPTFREVVENTSKCELFLCALIIALAIIGGGAASYSAINELATTRFTIPCYVQPFLKSEHQLEDRRHINCCGIFQNISLTDDQSICGLYVDYYKQH